MNWIVAIVGAVALLGLAVCCAALVEVFRNIAELRVALNLQDKPTAIKLDAIGARCDEVGLPESIAAEPSSIVVFLSPKCGTCLTIADAFRGGSPETVWFVLSGTPSSEIRAALVASAPRVVLDDDDAIANRLGLHVTPSVLTMTFGEISRAQAVASARQVLGMIPVTTHSRSGLVTTAAFTGGQQ